jgi:hypothetical protein
MLLVGITYVLPIIKRKAAGISHETPKEDSVDPSYRSSPDVPVHPRKSLVRPPKRPRVCFGVITLLDAIAKELVQSGLALLRGDSS